jgi:hypothetical protein
MRKLLILIFLCQSAFAKHEVGLTLGGLLPQDQGINTNAIHLGAGTALQANYGRRLTGGRVELSGEVHFVANPQRVVGSTNPAATRDVATIYVTPGIRLKFASKSSFSPYIAVGGGVAFYEQSLLQKDGRPNPAPRDISRGVFDFGGASTQACGVGLACGQKFATSTREVPRTTCRVSTPGSTMSLPAADLF